MKLKKVNFYLNWPEYIESANLRKFIISNLIIKGDVIRWSIIDIQHSMDMLNTKTLLIYAVLAE